MWDIEYDYETIQDATEALGLLHSCINEKWLLIVQGKKEDNGSEDCVLCGKYREDNSNVLWKANQCTKCPIAQHTGIHSCRRTPYFEWVKYAEEVYKYFIHDKKSQELAIAELEFLQGVWVSLHVWIKKKFKGKGIMSKGDYTYNTKSEALKALELLGDCIDNKWVPIVNGNGVDKGKVNCVLCKEYLDSLYGCFNCPIYAHTNKDYCIDTPYDGWNRVTQPEEHWATPDYYLRYVTNDETRKYAERMLEFLQNVYLDLNEWVTLKKRRGSR